MSRSLWFNSNHSCTAQCVCCHMRDKRCEDHATLCESWTLFLSSCSFSGGIGAIAVWLKDVCGGKGCVTGLVPENLSQPLPPELLRRLQKGTTLTACYPPPPSLPHEPAKPYLPTRMKKEKKTHALLFLLLLHFTSGKSLLLLFLFFFVVVLCVRLRLLALLLSG